MLAAKCVANRIEAEWRLPGPKISRAESRAEFGCSIGESERSAGHELLDGRLA
jgi:hypothetical protein